MTMMPSGELTAHTPAADSPSFTCVTRDTNRNASPCGSRESGGALSHPQSATSPRGVSLLQIMQSICDWETAEKKSRTT